MTPDMHGKIYKTLKASHMTQALLPTHQDFRNSYVLEGPAQVGIWYTATSSAERQTPERGRTASSQAAVWRPLRLCYRPGIVFPRLRLTALPMPVAITNENNAVSNTCWGRQCFKNKPLIILFHGAVTAHGQPTHKRKTCARNYAYWIRKHKTDIHRDLSELSDLSELPV